MWSRILSPTRMEIWFTKGDETGSSGDMKMIKSVDRSYGKSLMAIKERRTVNK